MSHKLLIDLITVPIFTGVIGYITNWTGVLMLFRPLSFHGVRLPGMKIVFSLLPRRVQILPLVRFDGGVGWQGIIPSRADKMASIAVDKGLLKLGDMQDFYRELEPAAIAERLTEIAQSQIREVVDEIMREQNPQLWRDLPGPLKEAVHSRVRDQLPGIVADIVEEIGDNLDQLIDAKLMVIRYYTDHPEMLNELFLLIGRKELKFMQRFGFYFGYPMGFLLVWLTLELPYWWVLPIGGVVIGWTVNYVGLEMIFEPARPTWRVPWRQGLLIKRQDEVTELYADMIARRVITLGNIGDELMGGPRSDRMRQLLFDRLRPAVDDAVGPARTAVRVAIGSREYDRIRSSVALQASTFAPIAFHDADFNRRQSGRIRGFIAEQMRAMSPEDFVEMLRSAIKQDEWLLFLHGGALGFLAGLLHLAIFGV